MKIIFLFVFFLSTSVSARMGTEGGGISGDYERKGTEGGGLYEAELFGTEGGGLYDTSLPGTEGGGLYQPANYELDFEPINYGSSKIISDKLGHIEGYMPSGLNINDVAKYLTSGQLAVRVEEILSDDDVYVSVIKDDGARFQAALKLSQVRHYPKLMRAIQISAQTAKYQIVSYYNN